MDNAIPGKYISFLHMCFDTCLLAFDYNFVTFLLKVDFLPAEGFDMTFDDRPDCLSRNRGTDNMAEVFLEGEVSTLFLLLNPSILYSLAVNLR